MTSTHKLKPYRTVLGKGCGGVEGWDAYVFSTPISGFLHYYGMKVFTAASRITGLAECVVGIYISVYFDSPCRDFSQGMYGVWY